MKGREGQRLRDLERRLRRAAIPGGADAERRAWTVVRAAAPAPDPRPHRRGVRTLVAAAVAASAVALAVSGAAGSGAEWALERLDRTRPVASTPPTGVRLPAAGRLLLRRDDGTIGVLHHDGSVRELGRWSGAAWSPRGRFVVAWRGTRLSALTPGGELRWTVRAPAVVQATRWSPDGFRIAFRTADGALRVVGGDGTGARQLARVHGAAFAWRPDAPHVLAWVRPDGRLRIRDADTLVRAAAVAAVPPPRDTAELSFSPGGRLLAWSPRAVRVYALTRPRVRTIRAGRDAVFTGAAFAPRGDRLALARLRRARDGILTVGGEDVLAGRGALGALAWSPDGTAIAAAWRGAPGAIAVRVDRPGIATLPGGVPLGWSR